MALAHREQNMPESISGPGNILVDGDCLAQKTSAETRRNITDMRLLIQIITDKNNTSI